MGQAYELGRVMSLLGRLFVVAILATPTAIGVYAKSWLWFFSALLVECIVLVVLFKADDKWGLSKGWSEKVLKNPE